MSNKEQKHARCPFCGGKVDPNGWLRGDGVRGPECESCGATAPNIDLWNQAAQPQSGPLKIGSGVTVENIGFGSERERKPYLVFADNGNLTEVNLIDVTLVSKRRAYTVPELEEIGVKVEQPAPVAVVGVDPASPGGDLCCELEGVVLPGGKLRIDKITHRESDGSYWQTHNPLLKTWNDCTQEEAQQFKRRGFFVRRIDLEAQP